jgi:hypothetical protein
MPAKFCELCLLMAARVFDAQYSWNAHIEAAIKEGVKPETPAAIAEHLSAQDLMGVAESGSFRAALPRKPDDRRLDAASARLPVRGRLC